jgi:hypothetical protein
LFSITFIGIHFLEAPLQSSLGQSFRKKDTLVPGDNSIDRSVDILERHGEDTQQSKLFRHDGRISRLCARCSCQLRQLNGRPAKHNTLESKRDTALSYTGGSPLPNREDVLHAYHLYVVPVAERVYGKILATPLGLGMNEPDVERVCEEPLHPMSLQTAYTREFRPCA